MKQAVRKTTRNHDQIRRWAEARGAHPATVKGTDRRDDAGLLRLDFPDYSGAESLQPISWEEFFAKFDESDLALVYEETTARGQRSNFNKLVSAKPARRTNPTARRARSPRATKPRRASAPAMGGRRQSRRPQPKT